MQHRATAGVDPDVVDRGSTRSEEDEVTRPQCAARHGPSEPRLVSRVARQHAPECTEDPVGEAGAVDARLRHAAPEVRRPEIAARDPKLSSDAGTAYGAVVGMTDHRRSAQLARRHPTRNAVP